MCSMSVLCPLCAHTSFNSIDALRNSLIKVANGPLPCPVCNECFLGLDKLTIHLFSHTNLMTHDRTAEKLDTPSRESPTQPQQQEVATNEMVNVVERQQCNKKLNENKIGTKMKEMHPASNNNDSTIQKTNFLSNNITQNERNDEQLASCDICEFTFRNEQLRDMHFNLVHQKSPSHTQATVEPIQPTLLTNSPTLPATVQPTTTNTVFAHDFKCHLCAKTYKTKGSLRVHLKVVHMLGMPKPCDNNSPTKLNICDRIRHKEAKVQKTNSTPTTSQQNSPQISNLLLLTALPEVKTVNQLPTLTANQPMVNGNLVQAFNPNLLNSNLLLVYTPQAGELVTTSQDSNNKSTVVDNPKIWECDVCTKSFTTKYFLKKHKRLHTGEMPYTCEICARTFTFQQSYHKHLLYHSDEKPHICATCGRAFKEVSTLHNHERIHSGEKPFKCEICGKCFRQRVSFLVHTRIHTGVMPYKCEQCQKSFRYKVSLRTHKCVRANETPTENTENSMQQPTSPPQLPSNENLGKIFSNQNSPASLEIATINQAAAAAANIADASCVEALLSKTIDEIVVESCKKMGFGNEISTNMSTMSSPQVQLTPSPVNLNGFNEGSSSPLQKLQEMRLYSPKFDMETTNANDNVAEYAQLFFK